MAKTKIHKLACPECLGHDNNCERCNGKGWIKVMVPQDDIPGDMRGLFKQPSPNAKAAVWIINLAILVALVTIAFLALASILK